MKSSRAKRRNEKVKSASYGNKKEEHYKERNKLKSNRLKQVKRKQATEEKRMKKAADTRIQIEAKQQKLLEKKVKNLKQKQKEQPARIRKRTYDRKIKDLFLKNGKQDELYFPSGHTMHIASSTRTSSHVSAAPYGRSEVPRLVTTDDLHASHEKYNYPQSYSLENRMRENQNLNDHEKEIHTFSVVKDKQKNIPTYSVGNEQENKIDSKPDEKDFLSDDVDISSEQANAMPIEDDFVAEHDSTTEEDQELHPELDYNTLNGKLPYENGVNDAQRRRPRMHYDEGSGALVINIATGNQPHTIIHNSAHPEQIFPPNEALPDLPPSTEPGPLTAITEGRPKTPYDNDYDTPEELLEKNPKVESIIRKLDELLKALNRASEEVHNSVLTHRIAGTPAANQPLPLSETQPLPLSETQPLPLSETQPLTLSETQPLPLSETQPLPLSETQPLPLSETQPLPLSETQPLPLSETQPLPLSETQPLPLSETHPPPASQPLQAFGTQPSAVFTPHTARLPNVVKPIYSAATSAINSVLSSPTGQAVVPAAEIVSDKNFCIKDSIEHKIETQRYDITAAIWERIRSAGKNLQKFEMHSVPTF